MISETTTLNQFVRIIRNIGDIVAFKDVDLERNIYLFNTIDKTMKKTKFKPEEENYYIGSMLRTGKDNLMIITTPDNADKKSNLNPKLYFTKLSDLNFQ